MCRLKLIILVVERHNFKMVVTLSGARLANGSAYRPMKNDVLRKVCCEQFMAACAAHQFFFSCLAHFVYCILYLAKCFSFIQFSVVVVLIMPVYRLTVSTSRLNRCVSDRKQTVFVVKLRFQRSHTSSR